MYEETERLEQHKTVWVTKEVYQLIRIEKKRLWSEEKRKVSMAKLINNAVIEKYGKNNS
jgi:hypothetical protein